MKKLLILFSFLSAVITVAAQKQTRITDETVVKDSSGTVYPASIWRPLLSTGKYTLRAEDPNDEKTAFKLIRLTDEEVKRRFDNLARPRESTYFTTGKKPQTFSGKDLNGNKYRLKDLAGKVVVLNFWFIGCGPCRLEMPELNKVVDEYKDSSNVVFIAIALDAQRDVETFLEKLPFKYNIISDGRYISSIYGVTGYPTHAVIDKTGVVVFHTTGYGAATIPWLRKSIAKAL